MNGKSSQEYAINAGVPEGSILSPTRFLPHVNNLPDDVAFDIAIYADDTSDVFRDSFGHTVTSKTSAHREAVTHTVGPY